MKIQYASDLHLEFFPRIEFETLLKPVAPILVLAGDIGPAGAQNTRDFLCWCAERWRHVIWVFGNHEYYIMYAQKRWKFLTPEKLLTMQEREEKALVWLAALPNVHFLQGTSIELEGIRFFGATLWTRVSEELHAEHGSSMADFKAIVAERDLSGAPVALTNAFRNQLHEEHLAALRDSMAAESSLPLVVITHHLPTGAVAPPIYHGEPTNPYYSNELWPELKSGRIAAWICGHSHGRTILEKPTLCVLNARGYPKQQGPENPYVSTAVVTITLNESGGGSGASSKGRCDDASASEDLDWESDAGLPPQSCALERDVPSRLESGPDPEL